jgi:predicted transcriptional regulator
VTVPKPTPAELEILRALWDLGPATVRHILQHIRARKPETGYTTVLKLMQIMTEKGLLVRDEKERTHVYRPAVRMEQTQRQLAGELLDKVFGGSAAALLMHALSSRRASKQELAKIRQLLDEMEGGRE